MKKIYIFALLCILCNLLCSSCKHVETITDTSYITKTDTVYISKILHDSIFTDRWHSITTAGDTVYVYDSVTLFRSLLIHDTLYNSKTDTVYLTKEKIVFKENKSKTKPFKTFKIIFYGAAGLILILCLKKFIKKLLCWISAKK